MARSRSLPSTLFDDPDFFESSSDIQVILIGLVLISDDYGRGLAHVSLLSRKLNKAPALIEEALTFLEAGGLLQCYHVEQRRYYTLTKWQEWETLSKPTPSKYPAPPLPQNCPGKFGGTQENLGKPRETPLEVEVEEEKEEERENEEEDGSACSPSNVVPFPTSDDRRAVNADPERLQHTTQHIAHILTLAVSDALTRVVQEYLPRGDLSLLGEADAASEWINDLRRNKQHKRMTPAFFRHWLQRECDARKRHEAALAATASPQQGTGTTDLPSLTHGADGPPSSSPGLAGRSLMDLEERYRTAAHHEHSTASLHREGEARA